MIKRFVLDTNILLQDPNALFGFADNDVILASTTRSIRGRFSD